MSIATCSASTSASHIFIRSIHHNIRVAHCVFSQASETGQLQWATLNLLIRAAALYKFV
jgi:hypothetical protein